MQGMFYLKREEGLGVIDTLIVCGCVGLLIAALLTYYHNITKEARETALQAGLRNIRVSVNLYRSLNQNQNPESLKKLMEEKIYLETPSGSLFEKPYLDAYIKDSEGFPLDPFGTRYGYDPETGEVYSRTPGYEHW